MRVSQCGKMRRCRGRMKSCPFSLASLKDRRLPKPNADRPASTTCSSRSSSNWGEGKYRARADESEGKRCYRRQTRRRFLRHSHKQTPVRRVTDRMAVRITLLVCPELRCSALAITLLKLVGLDGKFYVVLVANPLQAQLGQLVQWNSAMDDDGDVCCSGMIPQGLE